jgi:hypothetical protein
MLVVVVIGGMRLSVPASFDVRMQVAVLVGGMFTAVRRRRRWATARPAGTGVIDLGGALRPIRRGAAGQQR